MCSCALTLISCVQAPKKDRKEEDEEDLAFKKRKQEEAAAMKAAKDKGTCARTVATLRY